jgi:hypothetical protein
MAKGPAEIYGYPINDTSAKGDETRKRRWCPFLDQMCWKRSRRLSYPFGVCSVRYSEETVAVCPSRFWQGRQVFKQVAAHHFGSLNNLLLFEEVTLHGIGRLDYVIVKHKPLSNEIVDFIGLEVQTVDTTSTGGLVDAFEAYIQGEDIAARDYSFGLNWANVWKRAFTQALLKGVAFEHWSKKLYFVAQEPAYQQLMDRYNFHDLHEMSFDPDDTIVFLIYDIQEESPQYVLTQTRAESTTIHEMLYAIEHGLTVPSKERFVRKLGRKVAEEANARVNLELGRDH